MTNATKTTRRPVTATAIARAMRSDVLEMFAHNAGCRGDRETASLAQDAANGSPKARMEIARLALRGEIDITIGDLEIEGAQTGMSGVAYRVERGALLCVVGGSEVTLRPSHVRVVYAHG